MVKPVDAQTCILPNVLHAAGSSLRMGCLWSPTVTLPPSQSWPQRCSTSLFISQTSDMKCPRLLRRSFGSTLRYLLLPLGSASTLCLFVKSCFKYLQVTTSVSRPLELSSLCQGPPFPDYGIVEDVDWHVIGCIWC